VYRVYYFRLDIYCGAGVISPFDKIWACSFATFAAAIIEK
jgi:hypothetical protein